MSFLSRFSVANRSLVALATIAVLLIGAFLIPSLKQELYPSLEFPAISIISVYQGASPSIVEKDVTTPIEQNIQGLQGITQLTSFSNQGSSVVIVQYDYGTDLNQAQQTLTQHIARVQATLPTNVTPQVQTFNISDLPVIQLAVTSNSDQQALAAALKDTVVPKLSGVTGVANVNLTGVRDQIVTVTVDLKKLADKGVSFTQLQSALQANNITLPAGEITNNGQTLSVRVGNTFNSLDDLKNLVIGNKITQSIPTTGSGQLPSTGQFPGTGTTTVQPTIKSTPVKLSEVATVQQTIAPSTTLTRTNSRPSLGLSVTKTTDGNTVAISKAIQDQLPGLEKSLGNGTKITVVSDQAPSIQNSVDGLVKEGLIGAGFAILVILIFLLSIRSTLVTAISIPLSIVIALIGLWVGGFSLNLFTLGGLTIAVGRVIDDSIVVLENIYRHMQGGEDKRTAVLNGVREVAGAITASTLTTVAVFLPIAFTGGIVGQLFKPFSVTVTVALLASLFVALTIIPVLSYWFLKPSRSAMSHHSTANGNGKADLHERPTFLERGYVPILGWVTKHRVITLLVAVLIFGGSIALVPRLSTNFFDSSSQSTFTISQTLPPNTSLAITDQAASKVEAILKTVSGIKSYQLTIGSNGSAFSFSGSGGSSNTANFSVQTDANANSATVQQNVRDRLKTLTDAGTLTLAASSGGFNSSSVSIDVQANNQDTLQAASQQVLDAVRQAPHTTDVGSNLSNAAPLIDVRVDPAKAAKYGLSAAQVGQLLREVYTGTTATSVTFNGQQENVNLLLGTPADTVEDMKNLLLPATTGGTVKLSAIADVTQTSGPTQITHTSGTRTATISATVTTSNVGAVSADIQQRLSKLHLPDGATYSLGGVTSSQSDAFKSLGLAILLAIVLVYLIMVAAFRSLVLPLILLVSIPFAATGSIILLLTSGTSLGAPALIGLLMLVGIVVTNAIVLLDLVQQYRKRGLSAREAVIEGGRRRLRPILMTAVATILALIPMALGFDKSSGFIAGPLAVVVIGGLASSTILTLLIVPTLYVVIEGRRQRPLGGEDGDAVEAQPVTPTPEPQALPTA